MDPNDPGPGRRSDGRRWAAVVFAVAALGAGAVFASPEYVQGRRLIRDDVDRGVYMDRGSFVVRPGARPYRDVTSEYPQLATYLFAIPYLYRLVHAPDRKLYLDAFTGLMVLALCVLALVWLSEARRLSVDGRRVLGLLLPGTLYFTLNRFDVVPSLLVLIALALLLRGRHLASHAVLAVGFLTKAYPVLLLPLFVVETARRRGWRRAAGGVAIFGGVVAAFSAQLAAWSGPHALLAPYRWQLDRDRNAESLFHLVTSASPWTESVVRPVLLLGPVALAAAVVVARPAGRGIFRWAAAIVITFVLCTRFQSPQWVVWITPLALLAAASRTELALVIAQDALAYVYFPLAYDHRTNDWLLPLVLWAQIAVRLALVVSLLARTPPDQCRK